MKQKPSYSSIQRALACANAESKDYLNQISAMRKELDFLKGSDLRNRDLVRYINILFEALSDAQITKSEKPK